MSGFFRSFLSSGINWDLDFDIKASLVNLSLWTPSLTADQFLSDVPVGAIIATAAVTGKSTSELGEGLASDVGWLAVPGSDNVGAILLYKEGYGTSSYSALIALLDDSAGLPLATDGTDVTVRWGGGVALAELPEILRPDSDVSNVGWTRAAGSAVDLWEAVSGVGRIDNEDIADSTSEAVEFSLDDPLAALAEDDFVNLNFWWRWTTDRPTIIGLSLTAEVLQGATSIFQSVINLSEVSAPWTSVSLRLPWSSKSLITDETDLRIRFTVQSGTSAGGTSSVLSVRAVGITLTRVAGLNLLPAARHLVTGGGAQLLGVVDDVQLFNSPQGDSEEERLALRELVGVEAGLVDYFKFLTGTGTTAFGEEGATGTLLGTTQWVGFDGLPSDAGKRKPRVWGRARQTGGVQVDQQRLVWQVNHGPTQSITPTEGGNPGLANAGDFPNIYDYQPAPGEYSTCLARGLVRFGEDPAGPLAFDVEGDAPTDRGEAGYSENGAVILRRLAQRQAGVSNVDIDLASLDLLAVIRPGAVGLVTGTRPMKVSTAFDRVVETLDAWWAFNDDGKFGVGSRAASLASGLVGEVPPDQDIPTATQVVDFEITDDDLRDSGASRKPASEVTRSWTVRFAQYEVTMRIDEAAGVVVDKWDLTQDWRSFSQPIRDPQFAEDFPEAVDRELESLYRDFEDAAADAWNRISLDRIPWDLVEFPFNRLMRWPIRLGATFRYTGKLAPLGRVYVVAAVDRDEASDRAKVTGWGPAEGWDYAAVSAAQAAATVPEGVVVAGSAGRGGD